MATPLRSGPHPLTGGQSPSTLLCLRSVARYAGAGNGEGGSGECDPSARLPEDPRMHHRPDRGRQWRFPSRPPPYHSPPCITQRVRVGSVYMSHPWKATRERHPTPRISRSSFSRSEFTEGRQGRLKTFPSPSTPGARFYPARARKGPSGSRGGTCRRPSARRPPAWVLAWDRTAGAGTNRGQTSRCGAAGAI